MRGIDLELDALLEVDQVEVDLVGAVVQGEVGDQRVHQRRLARAGPAGDQDVLRGALPEREVLPLGRARLAERHVDAAIGCRGSTTASSGGAMNSNGTSTRLACLAAAPTRWICRVAKLGGRGRVERQRDSAPKSGSSQASRRAVPGQVGRSQGRSSSSEKSGGIGLRGIGGDRASARRRARRRRRSPPAGPRPSRRTWSGKSAITSTRYGSATSSATALYSSSVAYSFRRYFCVTSLHVRRQVGQPLLDLPRVGPDLVVDERPVEIGQVHERAEVPADADRIDDRESDLPGGRLVSSRNIDAWSTASAAARPSGGCSISRLAAAGKRPQGGERERVRCPPSAGGRSRSPRAARRDQ